MDKWGPDKIYRESTGLLVDEYDIFKRHNQQLSQWIEEERKRNASTAPFVTIKELKEKAGIESDAAARLRYRETSSFYIRPKKRRK